MSTVNLPEPPKISLKIPRCKQSSFAHLPVKKDNPSREAVLIDLNELQNRWIVGTPPAVQEASPFYSKWIQISYTNTNDPILRSEELHSHRSSEEYYLVTRGALKVRVGAKNILVKSMQLLRVPKKVPHRITEHVLPLTFFTMRVPSALPSEKTVVEE